MIFDKKVKDFMEENPGQTMLGFAWSLYWRLSIMIMAVSVVIGLFMGLLGD